MELKLKPAGLNVGITGENMNSQGLSALCLATGAQRSLQQAKVPP